MTSATHNQLTSPHGPHFRQLKPTIKAQISGRMASIGISDVVTAVYSEKTVLKKLMMMMMKMIIIIITEKPFTTK